MSIGLVLVHGIGNQRLGVLAEEMSSRLADLATPLKINSEVSSASSDKADRRKAEIDNRYQQITINSVPVSIREAHWAWLSHPDKKPEIRLVPYILREFLNTVSPTGSASGIMTVLMLLSVLSLFVIGFLVWIGILIEMQVLKETRVLNLMIDFGMKNETVIGVFLAIYCLPVLYSIYRRILHGRDRTVWHFVLPLYFPGLFHFTLVALMFDYIAYYIFARIFVGIGWVLASLRMNAVCRWVHRIGWVMVVLPIHSFLQAVKASVNLISILFTETKANVRAVAVLWLPGVLLCFLGLTILSELLIIIPLSIFFLGIRLSLSVIFFIALLEVFYLLFLRLLLPFIDLILDIGNYHLASVKDRQEYYQPIVQAVSSLRKSGCTEIHILAHSLGSVITYDWLCSVQSNTYPITVFQTIGSPLNKFWYLDHPRLQRIADVKGLTNIPSLRWINYWAYSDFIVSGPLARYGASGVKILNRRLRWLGVMFFSHVRYWKNPAVLEGIRHEIAVSVRGHI